MRASSVRHAWFLVVAVVGALVLPVAGTATAAAGEQKPLPKVSLAEARRVVRNAVELDVQAGTSNDKAILAMFATGLNLEIESGVLDLAAADSEEAFEPYTSKVVKVFTLRTTAYPRYFLAQTETDFQGGIIDRSVLLFSRESKQASWLWDRSIAHPTDGWPKFAIDADGYVRIEVDATKLLFDPATAPAELATYLSIASADPPPNAALFAPSFGTDEYRDETTDLLQGWPDGYATTFTATPTAHQVFTFRLKDGSALVSFGLSSVTLVSNPESNPDDAIEQDDTRSTMDSRIAPGVYREFTLNDLEDFSVVVPTKRSGDTATAIFVYYGPVSASAVPVGDPSLYE